MRRLKPIGKILSLMSVIFLFSCAKGSTEKPNIVLIMVDDMGYSDIGSYGGEIDTPNIDVLADQGVSFSQFYNASRCSPTRASLLTGLYPHKAQMGHLAGKKFMEIDGYRGSLDQEIEILPEVLRKNGYKNYMVGKWHLANYSDDDLNITSNSELDNTPNKRGFDEFYGTLLGGNNYFSPKYLFRNNTAISAESDDYYYTDVLSSQAVNFINDHAQRNKEQPFFIYAAYTAPHFPIQAPDESVKKYRERYQKGWDEIRKQRFSRMMDLGIIKENWSLSERGEGIPAWEDAKHKTWEVEKMAVHAAMIDHVDKGVGSIISALEDVGELDNTLIIFLSDNGASAEVIPGVIESEKLKLFFEAITNKYGPASGEKVKAGNNPDVMPGGAAVFQSIGPEWANVSNTPFQRYKSWVHEGGIATPLIVHWPRKVAARNGVIHEPGHVVDIMATILDAEGIEYKGSAKAMNNLDGVSLMPLLTGKKRERGPIFFEHEGNRAVRDGKWKLVAPLDGAWELYDMDDDRTETNNLAAVHPEKAARMAKSYDDYASRSQVKPWKRVLKLSEE